MIQNVEGFEKYIAIAGFKNVEIESVDGLLESVRSKVEMVDIQLFDARFVASKDHLYFAALNALVVFERGSNRSKSLAMEALLYASAQRQIRNAVEMIGISQSTTEVAVLVIAETEHRATSAITAISELISGQRDDEVVELTDEKFADIRRLFAISDRELDAALTKKGLRGEALIDLVIEHVALLTTQH